jgi:hypothetical protein
MDYSAFVDSLTLGNVFTEPLPSRGHMRHNIMGSFCACKARERGEHIECSSEHLTGRDNFRDRSVGWKIIK